MYALETKKVFILVVAIKPLKTIRLKTLSPRKRPAGAWLQPSAHYPVGSADNGATNTLRTDADAARRRF
jgi:hypothetical protein